MSINKYMPIVLGRQFIFKEDAEGKMVLNTITKKDDLGNDVTDYEIYELYPEGRKYIGSFGFVGKFWHDPFYRLVENTRYSVTFYSESYTRTMMPDWIEGTMANMMIAYSRVYKEFKKDKNIDDSTEYVILNNNSVSLNGYSVWSKVLDYKTGTEGEVEVGIDTDLNLPVLCYPFIIQKCPLLLRYLEGISGSSTRKFVNKVEIHDPQEDYIPTFESNERYSFPNVDIDKFNLLLP